jgi:hypothetical protein
VAFTEFNENEVLGKNRCSRSQNYPTSSRNYGFKLSLGQ